MGYRRSDDPDNQNAYITSGDTGAAATKSVITVRGSPDIYFTSVQTDNAGSSATQCIKGIDVSNGKLTFNANAVAQAAASVAFVNGFGPINLPAIAADDADVTASTATEVTNIFGATVATTDGAKFTYFIAAAAGSDQSVVSGSVLLINGRRYKVRSRGGSGATAEAKMVLSENFAGGQLRQLCASCVTEYTQAGTSVTSSAKLNIAEGDRILVGGYVHEDFATTVVAAVSDATAITGQTRALYVVQGNERTVPTIVTEASAGTTYHYVAQCSNRGACDAGTGLCKCFKGYSNDNCDTQNMLAA